MAYHEGYQFLAPLRGHIIDRTGPLKKVLKYCTREETIWRYFINPILRPTFGLCEKPVYMHGSTAGQGVDDQQKLVEEARQKMVSNFGPAQDQRSFSNFCNLPVELQHLVLQHLEGDALYSLGLTCQYFWELVRLPLGLKYISAMGSFAGTPVVLVPPERYAEAEGKTALAEALDRELSKQSDSSGNKALALDRENLQATRCYGLAQVRLDQMVRNNQQPENFSYMRSRMARILGTSGKPPHPAMAYAAYPRSKDFVPDGPLLLRNLTTREFVRSEIAGSAEDFLDKSSKWNVNDIVLCHIYWEEEAGHGPWIPHLAGRWAGHSLDIVASNQHDAEMRRDDVRDWRDATEEVKALMDQIWQIFDKPHVGDHKSFCQCKICVDPWDPEAENQPF